MTIILRYTEPILKRAIWCYLKKSYLKKLLLPSLLAVGLVIATSFEASPWLQAFMVVPAILIPVMLAWGYWLRIQESLKRLSLLENGQLKITVNESGVITEAAMGKSETRWKIYSGLWEFPDNYLLFYSNNQFITLPKNQVSSEFVDFIRQKLAANQTH